jgi:hypothetical protein
LIKQSVPSLVLAVKRRTTITYLVKQNKVPPLDVADQVFSYLAMDELSRAPDVCLTPTDVFPGLVPGTHRAASFGGRISLYGAATTKL